MTTTPRRTERVESAIQISILLLIGAMAGAASFTHVHDWTMANSPTGTGDWFGWANAVISELTPTAAGLEIRRRKRHHQPIAYPMAVLIAAAVLSIAAQLAVAKPGPTGWLLAAVPALAFLALSKLVLSRTATPTPDQDDTEPAGTTNLTATTGRPMDGPIASITAAPAPTVAMHDWAEIPAELLTSARMADYAHRQAHGHSITPAALADYLGITTPQAATALRHLRGETTNPATPGERR